MGKMEERAWQSTVRQRVNAASSHGAVSAEDSGIPSAAQRSFAVTMRRALRHPSGSQVCRASEHPGRHGSEHPRCPKGDEG